MESSSHLDPAYPHQQLRPFERMGPTGYKTHFANGQGTRRIDILYIIYSKYIYIYIEGHMLFFGPPSDGSYEAIDLLQSYLLTVVVVVVAAAVVVVVVP